MLHSITARVCLSSYDFVISLPFWLLFKHLSRDFEKTTITAMYHGRWFAYKQTNTYLYCQSYTHVKAEQLTYNLIQLITLIGNDFNSNSELQITIRTKTYDLTLSKKGGERNTCSFRIPWVTLPLNLSFPTHFVLFPSALIWAVDGTVCPAEHT